VYRGGGPKGIIGSERESFDKFLLDLAVQEGAVHDPRKIDRIAYPDKWAVLFAGEAKVQEPDLVVGAVGVKSQTLKIFEEIGIGYRKPVTTTAAIAEIYMDKDVISEYFGTSVNLFLLPVKDVKFAAIIPKGTYVTVCILGKNIDSHAVQAFIDHPEVQSVLPPKGKYEIACRCLPKMNVRAPDVSFSDRVVLCGDAGSTRLFKDGLGAAYIMGKSAAKTALLYGVGKNHFQDYYYPVYKSIMIDNRYGRFLFAVTDLHKRYRTLTNGMLNVVRKEQGDRVYPKRLSSMLWDMFTGNERYRNIFYRSLNFPLVFDLCREYVRKG
jgi:flavin-dependent dehydrogenase